ncbi:SICAvar, type I [Plasmodium knowlesi strain H]|uniref:SICAvar, type I n=1 Tax=Plasmodium knowlesi (strain H) TaxID=5851 RepID=A0A1A7VX78_PLAKH|nr:SICAvar, type I [Plasmodium knowlesi strain H]
MVGSGWYEPDGSNLMVVTGRYEPDGLECLDKGQLCDRAQCVSERWVENGKTQNGGSGVDRTWDNLWKTGNGLGKELEELSGKMKAKKGEAEKHCSELGNGDNKEACMLIAAGLKSIYEITANADSTGKITKKALEDQLFKRTMQCVLLNAFADKLEQLPCKDEKKVTNAITHAFTTKNSAIKGDVSTCTKDGDKCFTCSRYNTLASCQIGEKGKETKNVNTEVQPMLEKNETLKNQSLEKKICKPCKEDNFCKNLTCVANKWAERKYGSSTGNVTWDEMKSDFEAELESLLEDMKDKRGDVAKYCDGSGGAGWEDGPASDANEAACKLVAAGLQHISSIQKKYEGEEENPYDNQEFKQFASCLMLKAVIQKMKEESNFCNIEPGINRAFDFADVIKEEHCTNDKPCIECKFKDSYDDCNIGSNGTDEVKPTLEALLKDNSYKSTIDTTLEPITKTDQKETPLCSRLQCLASRVEAHNGGSQAEKFWKEEVRDLWKDLSAAMTKTKGNDQTGSGCESMDNGSGTATKPPTKPPTRPATGPEKKACNYLHAGLKHLYTTTPSAPSTSGTGNPVLDNPLLKQTVGCLLLHAYAKKMKEDSKCVIDSGIEKAFKAFNDINNANCNGKGQCVPCPWNEDDYDNCQITITGTSDGTTQTPVTEKLAHVQGEINTIAEGDLKNINDISTLCDYIKCAGPKWFKNKKETNNNSTQSWCDFWDNPVKTALTELFNKIESEGKKNNNGVCKAFGDDNPDSVERKACNHITAGLQHIKEISGNDQLLHQAVDCIALNMYADEIITRSNDKCPIGEDKITQMFEKWNKNHNSPCSGSGANNNGCFECTRQPNFSSCELSVDSSLVDKTTNGNCIDKDKRDNVQTEINKLLNEDKNQSQPNSTIKSNITTTLTTITEMTSSFCTQLQCAAKKWKSAKNKITNGKASGQSTDVNWDALKTDIGKELNELLEYMTKSENQNAVTQYCKDNDAKWNNFGHKERKTNKAACLLFAAGLQHIYKNSTKGPVKGPSFEQTMGCLFLKEYAKQLQAMANKKKQGNSWVHPLCDIEDGITHAFEKSEEIMNATSSCKTSGTNDCFVCKQNDVYETCQIGDDKIGEKVDKLFKDDQKQTHMQQTLENTVCPILLTDLLTPFLPLAPVSIGLSAMAYYLWKYFGPLGKGGPRFRRSPAEIRGPSVQEQVLDHVEEAGPHEYRLVKERKPRSAPTRTKRSGPVNRRTIIEIHFEVLDECQKGDTQLNQKDFLELLVQEFMGSEFMEEEEQVSKEEVLMEGVPMENVPMERVPSLASGFMV